MVIDKASSCGITVHFWDSRDYRASIYLTVYHLIYWRYVGLVMFSLYSWVGFLGAVGERYIFHNFKKGSFEWYFWYCEHIEWLHLKGSIPLIADACMPIHYPCLPTPPTPTMSCFPLTLQSI